MILTATINEVKRRILFDNPQAVVAVKGDYEVNGIAFAFPAIYEDDFDLSTAVKTVYYKATDGIVYNHVVTDTDTDTGYPLWVFKDEINKGAYGDVEFALVCDKVEGGNIVKRWVSMITAFRVQRSIEIDEAEQEDNEQTYSERLADLMTQMANMQATVSGLASGAPTPESLVANMQEGHIYVYTGTEPGYTAGHVYYYVGGALTDGGQYGGIALDATLTSPTMAAPASEVGQIKEDLSALAKSVHLDGGWQVGSFNVQTGNKSTNASRLRMVNSVSADDYFGFEIKDGFFAIVFAWNQNGDYVGRWVGNEFTTKTDVSTVTVKRFMFDSSLKYIYRIVIGADNSRNVTLDDSSNATFMLWQTERLNKLSQMDAVDSNFWRNGRYLSGVATEDTITRLITDSFPIGSLVSVSVKPGYEIVLNMFDANGEWIGYWNTQKVWATNGSAFWVESFNFDDYALYSDKKIAFTLRNANVPDGQISAQEGANVTIKIRKDGLNEYSINRITRANSPLTWGKSNVIANLKQMLNITWTPVGTIPAVGNHPNFVAGSTYKGMLYSSARPIGKNVGVDVSIKTFMTALKNPRSVLYTKRLNFNLGKAYYGSVCSTVANYALGLDVNYIGAGHMSLSNVSKKGWLNLQVGDILFSQQESHERVVFGVTRDIHGRGITVTYAEGVMPLARKITKDYTDFVNDSEQKGYIVLRSDDVDDTPYNVSEYVKGYDDEVLPDIIYPDVMCNYGDEATLIKGTDVIINVLNSNGYSEVNVYKDNVLIRTEQTLEDFVLSNLDYGDYVVTITDGNAKSSSSSFSVVDASCEWDEDTHILTFASANGVPRIVWLYDDGATKVWMRSVELTDEEIENGYVDLSEEFSVYPSAKNVRLDFRRNGNTASWFSYFNPAWVADIT